MTPSPQPQDLPTQWNAALRLYPIYFQLAREFVIDVQPCADLEAGADAPGKESVEHAQKWLEDMDARIQVHQLRQFLQTSPLAGEEGLLNLVQHFLAKTTRNDGVRDKIDFLLVQYFSQLAPSELDDKEVDLAYVAQRLEPALGQVELKTPVWLNALDRVLDSASRCRSLDELLHGGILAQGRKAKTQAGDLYYLPIALVAFTRFGYLMRRTFFHLMHSDLNAIVDGLNELEERKIETIDCRRAQFSAHEPITRLRMIVDLRVSIDDALGRGKSGAGAKTTGKAKVPATSAAAVPVAKAAAVGGASAVGSGKAVARPSAPEPKTKFVPPSSDAPEFEVSGNPGWDPDAQ